MRNRVWVGVILAGLMVCPAFVAAQSAPATSGGKVAVIDIQQAILETAQGKQAMQDLQKKYQPRETEIQQRQEDVQQLQQQLQKQMTTLSADEQRQMSHELQEKQTILRRLEQDAQSSFQYDRDTLMRQLGQKMVQVINQYASTHGYALVIDGSQVPVYYAAKGVDITPEIVKMYNSSHPVQTASASTDSTATASAKKTAGKPKP
ncbi:MAG: OmpH family outer membrane protein [Acidobacteria bacterium]|nr:OmpH family outer membrane protein [Acidobacteriota bacterium]